MFGFTIKQFKNLVVLLLLVYLKLCETTNSLSTFSTSNYTVDNDDVTRQQSQSSFTNLTTSTNEYVVSLKDYDIEPSKADFDTTSVYTYEEKKDKENKETVAAETSTHTDPTTKLQWLGKNNQTLDDKNQSHNITSTEPENVKTVNNTEIDMNSKVVNTTNQMNSTKWTTEKNYSLSRKAQTNKTATKNEKENNIENTLENVTRQPEIILSINTRNVATKIVSVIENNITNTITLNTTPSYVHLVNVTGSSRDNKTNALTAAFHTIETTKTNKVKHIAKDVIKRNPYKSNTLHLSYWTRIIGDKRTTSEAPWEKYVDWTWNNKLAKVQDKKPTMFYPFSQIEDMHRGNDDDFVPLILNDFYRYLPVKVVKEKNKLRKKKDHKAPVINSLYWPWINKLEKLKEKVSMVFDPHFQIEEEHRDKNDDFVPLILNDFYRSLPVVIEENKLRKNKYHKTPVLDSLCKSASERRDSLWK